MNELEKILGIMDEKAAAFRGDYYIPEKWNKCGFKNFKASEDRPNEINVNPYEFFIYTVKNTIIGGDSGDCAPLIYSALIRSLTAWDSREKGKVETGSFIKTILLLPMLKEYGVTVIYLLPICAHGRMNMKGELGSPYAIRDFYELDRDLHDELLGDYTKEMLHCEFCAFVEACHLLNIKVMLDFAFRTVSRDNVLIENHPDWFYWIKCEEENGFHTPVVGDGKKPLNVTKKSLKLLYENEDTERYLKAFTKSPDKLDPQKWEEAKKSGKNNAEGIKELYGITTVPGFSDVINDAQPPWTDVTYLRYYRDNAAEVEKYISPDQPPFIMQDGASLGVFHPSEKISELWDYISEVLPFYHEKYKIDGARIDMAHALPTELNARIIKTIRDACPDFLLWSEEFNPVFGEQAKKDGFDFISGFIYSVYKKYNYAKFNADLLHKNMLLSRVPIAAAIETPDTPRSMFINKNPETVKVLYTINSFLPNAYPMLNSGNELLEIQPMNLGLDNAEEGRYVLEKSDPMYGKLAFFDNYKLHWEALDTSLETLLSDISFIRTKYSDLCCNKENFVTLQAYIDSKKITALCFCDKKAKKSITIVSNRSQKENSRIPIESLIPEIINPLNAVIIFDKDGRNEKILENMKTIKLSPCETVVITAED